MNDVGEVSEDVRQLIYRFAVDELRQGTAPAVVKQRLIARGLEQVDAANVVRRAQQGFSADAREVNPSAVGLEIIGFLVWLAGSLGAFLIFDSSGRATFAAVLGTVAYGYFKFFRIASRNR